MPSDLPRAFLGKRIGFVPTNFGKQCLRSFVAIEDEGKQVFLSAQQRVGDLSEQRRAETEVPMLLIHVQYADGSVAMSDDAGDQPTFEFNAQAGPAFELCEISLVVEYLPLDHGQGFVGLERPSRIHVAGYERKSAKEMSQKKHENSTARGPL